MRFISIPLFILSSCTYLSPLVLPDGDKGYKVRCPELATNCIDKAVKTCKYGWESVESLHQIPVNKTTRCITNFFEGTSVTECYDDSRYEWTMTFVCRTELMYVYNTKKVVN